jgi:hypothetical protein
MINFLKIAISLLVIIFLWPVKREKPIVPRLPNDTEPRDCGSCDRLTGCMMSGNNEAPCNMYLPEGCMEIGDEREWHDNPVV